MEVTEDAAAITFIVFPAVERSVNGGQCVKDKVDTLNKTLDRDAAFKAFHEQRYGKNAVVMPCQCLDCKRKYLS